jgi:dihydropteroate synthase
MPLPRKFYSVVSFNWIYLTHVMGILNVTPDSFSDGGKHNQRQAVDHAQYD